MTLLSDCGMAPMMDQNVVGMNRAFSAGAFAPTASWGAAPGCYERCAFGAKHISQPPLPDRRLTEALLKIRISV